MTTEQHDGGHLAPVSYLPSAARAPSTAPSTGVDRNAEAAEWDAEAAVAAERAEEALLRSIRRRSISVEEAAEHLREDGVERERADEIVERFQRLGYLDDWRLAEEIIHSSHERKGQGRSLVERELYRRGVDSCVALEATARLPRDERSVAVNVALRRADSMRSLSYAVAERRLVAYLQRRGYGAVALEATREVLNLGGWQ
jgi:regulatory protein